MIITHSWARHVLPPLPLRILELPFFYIHFLCGQVMPVARTIVDTVAPDSPEYINFLHDSGVTTQFEVLLNKETRQLTGSLTGILVFTIVIIVCSILRLKRFLSNGKELDLSQASNASRQPTPTKRGRIDNN